MTLRAITVCVDYTDYLSVTLPYNRHHFSEMMVVTTPLDTGTHLLATQHDCKLHVTDAFYRHGAEFNKWAALEEALDVFGRHGWLCLMDADIVWPRSIVQSLIEGCIYTPHRRMMTDFAGKLPPEGDWHRYPLHKNLTEWAGWTQIFHAEDPHLGPPPWHETDWRHAGGADSIFQRKWPKALKLRPPFEVLHLGPAGTNWAGRVSPYVGGEAPPEAAARSARLREMLRGRGRRGDFSGEKVPG